MIEVLLTNKEILNFKNTEEIDSRKVHGMTNTTLKQP